jgi:sulfide:quinone oxidoreductase
MSAPLRVVIAGGGFAGVEALLGIRALAGPRVTLDLVSGADELRFRPLAVNEPFGRGRVEEIPLAEVCASADARLTRGRVTRVDVAARLVLTDATPPLPYDLLVVAVGARRAPVVRGATTFDGRRGSVELARVVDDLAAGDLETLAFTAPSATSWTLPIYELALLAAAQLGRRGARRASLSVVTPERAPLQLFGRAAGESVAALLAERGIELHLSSIPREVGVAHGRPALLTSGGAVQADRVVALPGIAGPRVDGLPCGADGFIATDEHGLVHGTARIYAAGDATAHPVKQGGLATQQADAVAASIAARAGAAVEPAPFDSALRALLLTGDVPLELVRGGVRQAPESRWPDKVAGRHLSAWLASREVVRA